MVLTDTASCLGVATLPGISGSPRKLNPLFPDRHCRFAWQVQAQVSGPPQQPEHLSQPPLGLGDHRSPASLPTTTAHCVLQALCQAYRRSYTGPAHPWPHPLPFVSQVPMHTCCHGNHTNRQLGLGSACREWCGANLHCKSCTVTHLSPCPAMTCNLCDAALPICALCGRRVWMVMGRGLVPGTLVGQDTCDKDQGPSQAIQTHCSHQTPASTHARWSSICETPQGCSSVGQNTYPAPNPVSLGPRRPPGILQG